MMKRSGTQIARSCVPSGLGASMLRRRSAEAAWGVASSVKATRLRLGWREKPGVECGICPYRKPTQVGRGKYPEVGERTLVKELGKLTP